MFILASGSPRRAEILKMMGYVFEIQVTDCDETVGDVTAEQAVAELSRRKAKAVACIHPDRVILGSDTLVTLDGAVLGKPKDKADAKRMLRMLSGREHTVFTGVTVMCGKDSDTVVSQAKVRFAPLTDLQIDRYIATGEPMDKAGAYGIQGRAAIFVSGITGDFFTVMGLPSHDTAVLLEKYGIEPEENKK